MLPVIDNLKESKTVQKYKSSPYLKSVFRSKKNLLSKYPTQTFLKFSEKESFSEISQNKPKTDQSQSFCKSFYKQFSDKHFEDLLFNRLEKLKTGNSKFVSEKEIIDSVYLEISKCFGNLKKIFGILRAKLEECLKNEVFEAFESKIDKLTKENQNLVIKINNLSEINSDLAEENKSLKVSQMDYDRLFKDNPTLLIKYQNIVDLMLDQCKMIENLKKENKKLRRIEILYEELNNRKKMKKSVKNKLV